MKIRIVGGGPARSGVRREGVRLRDHEPGETLAFDEQIAFLRAKQIASFKLPERLEVMDAFPISPVGKIMKRELREIVAARVAEEIGSRPAPG